MSRVKFVARFVFISGSFIACCFGAWGFLKLSVMQTDFRRLSQLVGELDVKDPTKTNVMRLLPDKDFPNLDRWRVYLPTSGRFSILAIQLQSKEYNLFDCENFELPIRGDGESFTLGFGEIETSDGRERVHFARTNIGSRSGFRTIIQPSKFNFNPETDFVVCPNPLESTTYDSQTPICLKAVYRHGSDGKPLLTSATYICPELGPTSHEELIPLALRATSETDGK